MFHCTVCVFVLLLQEGGVANATNSSGRIIIRADYSVINSTVAALEGDILTLSLTGKRACAEVAE